jgi:hypothetical protein
MIENFGNFTLTAGEALEADRLVKLSGSTAVYCDAGEEPAGATVFAAASGSQVAIRPLGSIVRMTASKVIAAGAAVYPANDGKVSDAAAGGRRIGTAITASTADGGRISVVANIFSGDLLLTSTGKVEWMDDFITAYVYDGGRASTTADRAAWLLTVVDGDSDAAQVFNVSDDGAGGILADTTNNKANDANYAQLNGESFKTAIGKPLYFEASVAINDVDKADFFIGLGITDTSPLTTTDRIGFQVDHDGNVDALVCQDSTESKTDTTVDVADCAAVANFAATKVKLAFYWDGVDTVKFYVNDVLKVTKTDNATTIVIPDDEVLTPTIALLTTAAQVVTAFVDYVLVVQAR